MQRVANDELKRRMLTNLADKYRINEIRELNHLSSYVGCRTRSFLDYKGTAAPTDQEVMLFALGYGLQDVLTPPDSHAVAYEKEGIIYRPDMVLPWGNNERLLEVKTTRKSAKHHYIDEQIPATWLTYMQGGCYILGKNQYDLVVLYLMGNYSPPFPEIYADTFIFDEQEIADNWKIIKANKEVLDKSLQTGIPPEPFKHCYDWECKYCRFQLVCKTAAQALRIQYPALQEDKSKWT